MDFVGDFAFRIFSELRPLFDWALGNWVVTLPVLGLLIFGAGKYRSAYRHHS